MKTIDDYRAGCRIMLGDETGRRYSDSMLDMGFREALGIYEAYLPYIEEVQGRITAYENFQAVVPLVCPELMRVRGVRRNITKKEMKCSPESRGGKLFIAFHEPFHPAVGELLQIELSALHTIKGLDAAGITTLPDAHLPLLCGGAAGYAMRIRARSVTEVFGKRPEDREALMSQADALITEFENKLKQLSLMESFNKDPWPIPNFRI